MEETITWMFVMLVSDEQTQHGIFLLWLRRHFRGNTTTFWPPVVKDLDLKSPLDAAMKPQMMSLCAL